MPPASQEGGVLCPFLERSFSQIARRNISLAMRVVASMKERSKKAGRTTIPVEVVAEVTRRLVAEFRKMGYARYHRLFVVLHSL